IVGGVRIADAEFRGDDCFFATFAQRLGKRLLRCAEAVSFRSVEAVDAAVEGAAYRLDEVALLDAAVAAADLPASETDRGNVDPGLSKFSVFHLFSSASQTEVCATSVSRTL